MFFYLSKILWFFTEPGNLFLFALIFGLFLCGTRFRKIGRSFVGIAVCLGLIVTFVPVGSWMFKSLEDRFPMPVGLPEHISGIVVLGGVIDPVKSKQRKVMVIGGAVERITESAALAKTHTDAKILYTGGSGSLVHQDSKEADFVVELYQQLGIPKDRLIIERNSRNTWENAKFSVELAAPKPGENWLLVTSAFHMPRAVGVFRRVGWEMIPYPVDFYLYDSVNIPQPMSFASGLGSLGHATHEWIGLIAYWLTGRNSSAFPKPRALEG